jgi:hypothetical protein
VNWGPTHRLHLTWVAWYDEQQNHPSRSDQYTIQLTYLLYMLMCGLGGSEPEMEYDDFVLEFGKSTRESHHEQMTEAEYSAHALAAWGARVGLNSEVLKKAVDNALGHPHQDTAVLPSEDDMQLAAS